MNRRVLLALLMLTLSLFACMEASGEGRKAEEGYQLSEEVIAALEQYHADNGEYPEQLDQLIPTYLTAIPTGEFVDGFTYTREGDSYILTFAYVGRCINICDYRPEQGWVCDGYC